MEGHAIELPIQFRDDLTHGWQYQEKQGQCSGQPFSHHASASQRGQKSMIFWVSVKAQTMVMNTCTMPKSSSMTLAKGAKGGAGDIADNLEGVVILLMLHAYHS